VNLQVREARRKHGQWITVDGGALRLKVFKVGTAHLEIHPEMAWRLNATLAHLHPFAIPAEFRQRPRKKAKDWAPLVRPLPHRVLAVLGDVKQARRRAEQAWPERYEDIRNAVQFRTFDVPADALREAEAVLESIGGVKLHSGCFQFAYDALDVIHEIVFTGCIPDAKSHQFYPTPERLARMCVELAEIGEADKVLEPSAGQGAIATLLPAGRTTAVELSDLQCNVLRAKLGAGADVICHDFILQADDWWLAGRRFDRVVMNPPFADGRAKLHAEYAGHVVAPGGRLVAILPASMRGKPVLGPDFEHAWHGPYTGEFAGTDVSVVILVADRKA
jgi:hypothetical protein